MKHRAFLTVIICFVILGTSFHFAPVTDAFTSADADTALSAFNQYCYNSSAKLYYNNTDHAGIGAIWTQAIFWDIIMDAYQRTNSTTYRTMIDDIYTGGYNQYDGYNWSNSVTWFIYDDMMWWVIALARSYQITGNVTYLDKAISGFNYVWNGSYDPVGGGMWWDFAHTGKNSCINFPTIIAAMRLYNITGDTSYLTKAQTIYTWARSNLVNTSNGRVADNKYPNGSVGWSDYTYNQGTFIGAAVMLYKATGTASYLNDANLAANYTKSSMCNANGILPAEGDFNEQGVMKAIFARYMLMLIKDCNQSQHLSWMQNNATTAWNNRDKTRNLTYRDYTVVCSSGMIQSYEACSAVGLMQVCPPEGSVIPTPTPTPNADKCVGGVISVSSTASPAGEDMTKAFDNLPSTKWLIGNPTGWIQYDFSGTTAWAINQYTITSANDVPARDPKNWTLQGSNDGTNWTTVNTQSNQTFASRNQKNTYSFTNTTAYQMYRLNITANNGDSNLQIAEIEMFVTGAQPTPTATRTPTSTPAQSPTPTLTPTPQPGVDKCTGGTISVSSTNSPVGEEADKAFDNSTSTKWLIGNPTGWIQYDFAGLISWAINQYTITSANDYPTRDPKNWTFQGSNDGTVWITLDTRTNETFASRFLKKTYSFTNTTAYQMYRFNVTANNGDSGLQIAEIEMFAGGTGVIFYQNDLFLGAASQVLGKGNYTMAQLNAMGCPDNWMTSLKVPSGWTVIAYQNDNFGGTSWTFTTDTSNVGSACNDQMTSCRIQ